MSTENGQIVYSEALRDALCERIASGETLIAVCESPNMPAYSTFYRWRREHPDLCEAYALAVVARAERWAEELVDIADNSTNDYMERERRDGSFETVLNRENIQRSDLRIRTRQWRLARLLPKEYGERSQLAVTGPDNGPLQSIGVQTTDPVEAARIYLQIVKGEK